MMHRALICLVFLATGFSSKAQSVADSLFFRSEYVESKELYLKALETNPSNPHLKGKIGRCLIRMGKNAEAEKWLSDHQSEESMEIHFAQAELYMSQGRLDKAEEKLKPLLEKKGLDQNTRRDLYTLFGLTGLYGGKGYIAEEYLNKARLLASSNMMSLEYADVANNYGLYLMQTAPQEASGYFQSVQAIYRSAFGDAHPKVINAANNLALSLAARKNFFDAINMMTTVLGFRKQVDGENHPNTAFAYFGLAQMRKQTGNLEEALVNLSLAEGIYRAVYKGRHPDLANVLNMAGAIRLEKGDFNKALSQFQEAIIANSTGFGSVRTDENPGENEPLNDLVMLNTLTYKAEALLARYGSKSLLLSDLKNALAALDAADKIVSKTRRLRSNSADKLALTNLSERIYGQAIRAASLLAEVSPQKKKSYEAMIFAYFEKNRAAVLADAIAETEAKDFAGIPPEVLEEERGIKADITMASRLIATGNENESLSAREKLFELNRSYEQLIARLEKDYPSYHQLKYSRDLADIPQTQSRLTKSQAMLTYYYSETGKRLYGFLIEKKRYRFFSLNDETDLQKNIRGFRNAIYFGEADVYEETARKLFKALVPVSPGRQVKHLVIIPDGAMSLIPFEALLTDKPDIKGYPFLLNKVAVSNAFSASLYVRSKQNKREKSGNILVAAPVEFYDKISPLIHSEAEAEQVGEILKKYSSNTRKLVRGDARKPLLNEALRAKPDVVHIATHGFIDEEHPELSRLLLHGPKSGPETSLYAGEIYNLNMNTDLVTLSACQTGLGKIAQGEGIIGFSRAFTYAGAKNLLVSYWNVADESTARLMCWFYEEMSGSNHQSFAESLRRAKLRLIDETRFKSPYYWAAFFVIGE